MKKVQLFALALLVSGLMPAQTYAPSGADKYVTNSNSVDVRNTGSDSWSNVGITNTMHVMVCDGNIPSFGWSNEAATPVSGRINLASSLGINSIAKDPDVSIDATGTRALSVFLTSNTMGQTRVYYQRYQRTSPTATVWTLLGTSTAITPLAAATTPYTTPNIEVSNTGRVVVTYAQSGNLYCTTINISTGAMAPTTPVSMALMLPAGLYQFRTPDVAVYTSTGGVETAIFTYVGDDGSTDEIFTSTILVNDIVISNIAAGTPSGSYHTSLSKWFSEPRIATMWTYAFGGPNDWTIVVGEHDPSNVIPDYIIYNITSDNGIINGPLQLNNATGTGNEQLCPNVQPCVTYSGDYIVVAWAHEDCSPPYLVNNTGYNIIARKLTFDGNVASPWASMYSLVNADVVNKQAVPSLSDCRFSNNQTSRTRYCWYQDDAAFTNKRLAYRFSPYSATNVRLAEETESQSEIAPVISLSVNPNPASSQVSISLPIAQDETAVLRIFSADGKLVSEEQLNGSLLTNYMVNTDAWENGLYLVRIQSGNQVWTSRLVVKH
jgi:hypothetical protein